MQVFAPEVRFSPSPCCRWSILFCLLSLRSIHTTEHSSPGHFHLLGEDRTSLFFLLYLTICSSSLCLTASRLILLKGKTLEHSRTYSLLMAIWCCEHSPLSHIQQCLPAAVLLPPHSILAIKLSVLLSHHFFWGGISLCGLGCPQTHDVLASGSWEPELEVGANTLGSVLLSRPWGLSVDNSLCKTLAHSLWTGQHPFIH